jgi:asparagine synthase (glutamine-hydrolysing)
MCGVVGIIGFPQADAEAVRRDLDNTICLLRHRGPDDGGVWMGHGIALGHTRLSIIDLSPKGAQPMSDPSGRWTIAYNGEVYNYVELRDQLRDRGHTFRSRTDTEVVLAALIEWGPAALERLNGMWALALWDAQREELFLARDRAGKKPLYLARLPRGNWAFSSEITPLLRLGASREIHRQAAFDFLTQGTYGHLGARTFFDGIEQLPAAHYALVRRDKAPEPRRYWDLPRIAPRDLVPYDVSFRATFRDLMTDAVRLRLRSDVPVGATLSGGLDSSTIVLLVDRLSAGAPLHLFTSLYPGTRHDETPFFESVVRRMAQPVIHRAQPDPSAWRDDLIAVLAHQEEPFGDTSILAHFTLMREARRAGVPVILSGQGGDELLLGYPSMVTAFLGARLASGDPAAIGELWRWAPTVGMGRGAALRNVMGAALPLAARDRIRQRFVARMAERVTPALRSGASLRRFEPDGRDALSSYLRQVFTRFAIPHLTHYDDRNAMAFSVEGRMPFLDVRLIELMYSVRGEALFSKGFTKRVLRESFADLLPPEVRLRRDKIGFYTPLADWLRANAGWIEGFMTPDRLVAAGLLRVERYTRAVQLLGGGRSEEALEVWRGFILHLWMERFGVSGIAAARSAA